jgi:NADH dehydrogenase (ubiquinone) 1 alpha subcomplex subunit 2
MASVLKAASPALREVRIHLCQTSEGSRGVREFIQAQYPAIKKSSPKLPFMVREASGVQARAYARFGKFGTSYQC